LHLTLAGDWLVNAALPPLQEVNTAIAQTKPNAIRFDATELGRWDSGTGHPRHLSRRAVALDHLRRQWPARRRAAVDRAGLRRQSAKTARTQHTTPFLQKVGESAQELWRALPIS
jgi:hypothetical protein